MQRKIFVAIIIMALLAACKESQPSPPIIEVPVWLLIVLGGFCIIISIAAWIWRDKPNVTISGPTGWSKAQITMSGAFLGGFVLLLGLIGLVDNRILRLISIYASVASTVEDILDLAKSLVFIAAVLIATVMSAGSIIRGKREEWTMLVVLTGVLLAIGIIVELTVGFEEWLLGPFNHLVEIWQSIFG